MIPSLPSEADQHLRPPIGAPSPTTAYLSTLQDLNRHVASQLAAAEQALVNELRAAQSAATAQLTDGLWHHLPAMTAVGDLTGIAQAYTYLGAVQHACATANSAYGPAIQRYVEQLQAILIQARDTASAAYRRILSQTYEPEKSSEQSDRAAAFGRSISTADFVSHLVRDPANPPSTLLLFGFPGEASRKGLLRFYLDAALSAHVEIPEDKVLGMAEVPAAQSPLGGCYVWIERDPELLAMIQESVNTFMSAGQPLLGSPDTASGAPAAGIVDPFGTVMFGQPPDSASDDFDDDVPLPPGWPVAAQ